MRALALFLLTAAVACAQFKSTAALLRRHSCLMPRVFRDAAQPALIVGQDGILRAGWQPAPDGLFTRSPGGLPTRSRLPTCPTTSAAFPFVAKRLRAL